MGLATKIDTTLIVEVLVKAKIDVPKTIEEGRVYNSIDEVVDTSINNVLS